MLNIEKQSLICKEYLDSKAYLESLLAEGERAGLLTEHEVGRIQYDCLDLLSKRLEQRYGKKSSSVPEELAGEMLESVLYTVGLQLKAAPTPDAAIVLLKESPLPFLYMAGLRKCRILLRDVRVLADALRDGEADCANPFCRAAIHKDLPAFLKSYRPDSKAHEHGFFPVYGVEHPRNDLTGVEYVRAYARSLLLENRFCSLFSPESLRDALNTPRGRAENLFHTVLRNACIKLLTFGTPNSLHVTDEDMEILRTAYTSADSLEQALQGALETAFGKSPYARQSIRAVAKEIMFSMYA